MSHLPGPHVKKEEEEEPALPLVPTSITDLIFEETAQTTEDEDADVIRLAQHRPYLQHLNSQPNSPQTSNGSHNTNTFPSHSRSSSNNEDTTRLSTSRMLVSAVLIPSRKRLPSERSVDGSEASSGGDVGERYLSGGGGCRDKSPAVQNTEQAVISVRSGSRRLYTQRQKTILEKAFSITQYPSREVQRQLAAEINEPSERVNMWFTNRRQKERSNKKEGSATSTATASPAATPPSEEAGALERISEKDDREDTPSADGVLGSASVRYRSVVIPPRPSFAARPLITMTGSSFSSSINKSKMASSEVARWISTVLRGGSIVKSEDIEKVVDLMLGAVDMDGRKYILNALLSTKSTQVLHTFMKSRGPVIFRTWIAEARKDISNSQCEEILLKTIDVLMALPFNVERLKDTQVGKAIKLLASDKRGSQELSRKASELKDKWLKLISDDDSISSPQPSTDPYESARKKPRNDFPAALAEMQQSISQLPRFVKAKPATASDAGPRLPSRKASNPDFFKEIAPTRIVTTTASTSRPNSTSAANLPATTALVSLPLLPSLLHPSITPPTPVSMPPFRPSGPPTKKITFDPLSAEHNKAREAAMKLVREQQSAKIQKKRVRFKDDEGSALVDIRIIEPIEDLYDEDHMDEIDSNVSHADAPSDEDEDEPRRNSRYSSSPPPPSLQPTSPTWGPGSMSVATRFALHHGPPRPTFIIPEHDQIDLLAGLFWRHPLALHVQFEPDSDGHIPIAAEGEESAERNTQANREAITPPVEYASVSDIPLSPAEPDDEPLAGHEPPKQIQLFEEAIIPANALIFTFTLIYQKLTHRNFNHRAL